MIRNIFLVYFLLLMIPTNAQTSDAILSKIDSLYKIGETNKANKLTKQFIELKDIEVTPQVREKIFFQRFKYSNSMNNEFIKILKNQNIKYKKDAFSAMTKIKPDSSLFIVLNKYFSQLDHETQLDAIEWLTELNKENINRGTLYLQNTVIEKFYTDTLTNEKLKIGQFLLSLPNDLSLVSLTSLLGDENEKNRNIAKNLLSNFQSPHLETELRKQILNKDNNDLSLEILDIYRQRHCSKCLAEIIALINTTENEEIKNKAYETIVFIATPEQIETLEILKSNSPEKYHGLLNKIIMELKKQKY